MLWEKIDPNPSEGLVEEAWTAHLTQTPRRVSLKEPWRAHLRGASSEGVVERCLEGLIPLKMPGRTKTFGRPASEGLVEGTVPLGGVG